MNKLAMKQIVLLLGLSLCAESNARGGFGGIIRLGRSLNAVSNASKVYDINTLSIDRLKSCIYEEKELDKFLVQLEGEEEILNNRYEEVEAFGNKIKVAKHDLELKQVVKMKDNREIDAFNREVDVYNSLVKTYKIMVEKYNSIEVPYDASVDKYEKLRLSYNVSCGGKRYYEDDMAIVKRQLNFSDKT